MDFNAQHNITIYHVHLFLIIFFFLRLLNKHKLSGVELCDIRCVSLKQHSLFRNSYLLLSSPLYFSCMFHKMSVVFHWFLSCNSGPVTWIKHSNFMWCCNFEQQCMASYCQVHVRSLCHYVTVVTVSKWCTVNLQPVACILYCDPVSTCWLGRGCWCFVFSFCVVVNLAWF